jgi:MFS family permease
VGGGSERDARYYGWYVVLGCLVCQIGLGLGGYIFAVFLKPVVSELGWSRTAYSAAGGPLLLAMSLASPLAGALTERIGARAVFSLAIVLVGAALVGLSYMDQVWELYAFGLLLGGAITGLGDIPAGAVVAQWFRERRGVALGVVYIGSNIGGAIVPIAATAIAAVSSWRVALRVVAIAGCVLILPFALGVVRERRTAPAAPDAADAPSTGMALADARRTPAFWVLAAVLFTFYFYYLGVNNHLVAYLTDSGFSDAAAARRFSAAVAVGIAGKLGIGLVADRVHARTALLVTFGLLTAGSFLLLGLGRMPGLLPVFLTVHGLTVAAENVVMPLAIAHCFGTRHLAAIYGALMVMLLPGGAGGATFAGWVFDVTGTYHPAFVTFAVLNTLAFAGLTALRPARSGHASASRSRAPLGS